ncbi:MAG TPA: GHMP kinase [Phycisphaerales bacterium]|nr:GHMP kinase [Phycisphaerales bacterium]
MDRTSDKAYELFVPGRICLFGEHSDWAAEFGLHKGHCLVVGTDQGLSAVARAADSFTVETLIPDPLGRTSGRNRQMSCRWDAKTLLAAAKDEDEFFRYCAGVAYEMSTRPGVRGGLDLRITAMDLPLKKGVSSSAAVCILVAKAFDTVYGLGLFPHELMDLAYLGERLTGSQCGRMDQACIYGKTPVLLTFAKGEDIRVEPIFPGGAISMFFVDLAGQKDTVKILNDLRWAYLQSPDLQRALGESNAQIVRQAYHALAVGDAEALGRLMIASQKTFDELVAPHSPEQLASPLLHQVLSLPELAPHIYGGKGVGSQGDGTAQMVARSPSDRDTAMAILRRAMPQMQCFPLTISPAAANGAAHA